MKASILKGTRDFQPEEVVKRKYIFDVIERVFSQHAYQPLETPAMEKLETLTGKYGEEGDRLLFKILNNGDYLAKADTSALEAKNSNKLTHSISKRGLRYDLTVPFARFVVMNQSQIAFPFKRFQIQPVWRADRPQKGRYQEFYQCDGDVVGSDSLMYEAELIKIYDKVFAALNLKVTIRINNRKLLEGLAEVVGLADQFVVISTIIDKLDKIGEDGVVKAFREKSFSEDQVNKIMAALKATSLDDVATIFGESEIAKKGIEELKVFHQYFDLYKPTNEVKFDMTLARGLGYYTGCIFEVDCDDFEIGSIGGGGRYDNLTGVFGLKGVSGVGISFGAARIYDAMEGLNLFPADLSVTPRVLILAKNQEAHLKAFELSETIREAGITCDVYPSPEKFGKQMKYANRRDVPFVLIIGEQELESGLYTLKDMVEGSQKELNLSAIISLLGE